MSATEERGVNSNIPLHKDPSDGTASLSGPALGNPLTKKLNKILETRIDNDKDVLEALKALSSFFTDNNLRTRRNLRSDIERRSLSINEDFANAFMHVRTQLDSVCSDVQSMSECVADMNARLKATKAQTNDLISQTNKLRADSQELDMRSQVVSAFLKKYHLTSEEMRVLRGVRDGPLHPDFFRALHRVKEIHNDCKVLLRTKQQTAGLEIMESMALHQEAAYERVYRWAQLECRTLNNDSPEISQMLSQAMASLQDRPVLFKYTLDEFCTARRAGVVRGFIDALTRGGPGGAPRPIELHSHDPLRYVGDMLAWLHQTTASEKEHLQTLLTLVTMETMDSDIRHALSQIIEGVCRPLKVRVEQVIVSEPGAVILYKLTNLLKFYENTLGQNLHQESSQFLTIIDEMHQLGAKMFFNTLNVETARLLDKVELPPTDLAPTNTLTDMLVLLQEILSSHDSSVMPLEHKQQDFSRIIGSIVDPLLQMCSMSASRLNTVDMAVYMINCIHMIHSRLSLYEYTDHRLEMLQAQTEAHMDAVVSEQASYILNRVGLAHFYGMIQQKQTQHSTSSPGGSSGGEQAVHDHRGNIISNLSSGLDVKTLQNALSKFDDFLSSPDTYQMSQCKLLISTTLRKTIWKRAMELIIMAYRLIHQEIHDPQNGYVEILQQAKVRDIEQVTKLLA